MAFYPSQLISRSVGRLLRCGDVTDADDPRRSSTELLLYEVVPEMGKNVCTSIVDV